MTDISLNKSMLVAAAAYLAHREAYTLARPPLAPLLDDVLRIPMAEQEVLAEAHVRAIEAYANENAYQAGVLAGVKQQAIVRMICDAITAATPAMLDWWRSELQPWASAPQETRRAKPLHLVPAVSIGAMPETVISELEEGNVAAHEVDVVHLYWRDDARWPLFKAWLIEQFGEDIREHSHCAVW